MCWIIKLIYKGEFIKMKKKEQTKKLKKRGILLSIVIILIVLAIWGTIVFTKKIAKPEIELVGDAEIILNLNQCQMHLEIAHL